MQIPFFFTFQQMINENNHSKNNKTNKTQKHNQDSITSFEDEIFKNSIQSTKITTIQQQ